MRHPVLLGLAGGLVATGSIQPFGWWPLGLVGAALLVLAWWGAPSRRSRAAAGAAWGIGLYGPSIVWVTEFQAAGYVALVLICLSWSALAGALLPTSLPWRGLAAAGAIALAEAFRQRFPFQGFPLGGLPLGQAAGPLVPTARLGGTTLLMLAIGLVAAGLAEAWLRRPRTATVLVAPALALALLGFAVPDGREVGRLRIAAVQGGGPRGTRGLTSSAAEVLERHLVASRTIPPGSVDVVLWPENVVSTDGPVAGSPEGELVAAEARRLRAVLLVGVVEDEGPDRFRNAQVAYDAQGRQVGRYDKVHRVPFGEYAPLRELVAKVADLSLLPRDAIPGKGPGLLRGPDGERLGVVISYEVFFGDRSRSAVEGAGAQVLLVPTNAASYKTSQVPDQEVAAARLRAWETGRDVVQAAPTGFTAFVRPRGAVRLRPDLGVAATPTDTIALREGSTPYQAVGDPPWLLLALAAAAGPGAIAALRTRRRRVTA